jgi:hypothetical protein
MRIYNDYYCPKKKKNCCGQVSSQAVQPQLQVADNKEVIHVHFCYLGLQARWCYSVRGSWKKLQFAEQNVANHMAFS